MKLNYDFTFLGKSARLIRHRRVSGGRSVSKTDMCPNITIEINDKYNKPLFLKFLMHELFEIGAYVLGCDYKPENPNRYNQFIVINHIELTNLVDAVQVAYEEIKRNIGD